jgi:hypothetical protein
MGFHKGHKEFHTLDLSEGWQTPPGYPDGIQQKIISGALDEKAKHGSRTRLLRFAPGVYTTKPFVHEYWEEVFLVSGDLIVGNDEAGKGGEKFEGYTYAVRPPGVYHGPPRSQRLIFACSTSRWHGVWRSCVRSSAFATYSGRRRSRAARVRRCTTR